MHPSLGIDVVDMVTPLADPDRLLRRVDRGSSVAAEAPVPERLRALLAIKEAVTKAIGGRAAGCDLTDVEVVDAGGAVVPDWLSAVRAQLASDARPARWRLSERGRAAVGGAAGHAGWAVWAVDDGIAVAVVGPDLGSATKEGA